MSDLFLKLHRLRDLKRAKKYAKFFKTGEGEYAEKDKFLGISVPEIRKACGDYPVKDLKILQKMFSNEYHEIRFAALVCLINLYQKTNQKEKKKIFKFYLKNIKKVNNWDLVDISAPNIVGDYIFNNKKETKILDELAKSENLWERRVAVVSNLPLIKKGDFKYLEKISIRLLKDKEDLIQKSVGWMLREAGKVNQDFLICFLNKNYQKMPRTMLRYSIEKLDMQIRNDYLKSLI